MVNGTNPPLYDFEGKQYTAAKLAATYRAWSRNTLLIAHSEGCRTVADMHARDARCRAAIAQAQTKNARRMPPIVMPSDRRRNVHRRDLCSVGIRS